MDFQSGNAIHHMGAGFRQFPGTADIVFFIKTGFDLKQDRDLLSVPCGFYQRIHNGRVAADAIQSLLDRQHIRILRRFFQQPHHRIEGFVGMVDHQGAAAPDIFDHAQIGIDPQRRKGRHGIIGQFRHLQGCQFPEIFQVQRPVNGIGLLFRCTQFFLQESAGFCRGGLRHFQPDHDPFCLALKRDLHFRKQIVNGFFINGKIHISGDAERRTLQNLTSEKQRGKIIGNQLFRRDKSERTILLIRFHRNETGNNGRYFHDRKRFSAFPDLAVFPLQIQANQQFQPQIRHQWERMGRVHSDRRQHRQDLPFKEQMRRRLLGTAQFIVRCDPDPVFRQLRQDIIPIIGVLFFHKFPDPFIQIVQQFTGSISAIVAHQIFLISFFPHDRRHTHHKKLIQITAEDSKKFQPLQQRIAAIGRLIQHTAVEFQPADVTVDKVFIIHAVSCSCLILFLHNILFPERKSKPLFRFFSCKKRLFRVY